jgi:hypothetical protein
VIPIYQPVKILVTFLDAKETPSSTYIWLPVGVSFETGGSFGEGYASALEPASGAKITGLQIIGNTAAAFSGRPPSTSDGSRVGTLIFGTADPDERWILEIPSLRQDLLLTSGPYAGIAIDLTLPAITAIADLIIAGDGTVSPTGLTGNDLSSVITGLLRIP